MALKKKICIDVAAAGPSCSTREPLGCVMRTFSCRMWDLSDQGDSLSPLNWERGALAPDPPGSPPSAALVHRALSVSPSLPASPPQPPTVPPSTSLVLEGSTTVHSGSQARNLAAVS